MLWIVELVAFAYVACVFSLYSYRGLRRILNRQREIEHAKSLDRLDLPSAAPSRVVLSAISFAVASQSVALPIFWAALAAIFGLLGLGGLLGNYLLRNDLEDPSDSREPDAATISRRVLLGRSVVVLRVAILVLWLGCWLERAA